MNQEAAFIKTLDERLHRAVQLYWDVLDQQATKQRKQNEGAIDTGARSRVTGGNQLVGLENLLVEAVRSTGLMDVEARIGRSGSSASTGRLELPGYYRPEKKWDLLVLSKGHLIAVVEFKSQVGPSFGNNANNRAEEAIGSAADFWKAYREERFGTSYRPFLGYFFLLEDCPKVHTPVRLSEANFEADPVFRPSVSYAKRYEILTRRLIKENLYSSACLVLATKSSSTEINQPAEDLSLRHFVAALIGHVHGFVLGQL